MTRAVLATAGSLVACVGAARAADSFRIVDLFKEGGFVGTVLDRLGDDHDSAAQSGLDWDTAVPGPSGPLESLMSALAPLELDWVLQGADGAIIGYRYVPGPGYAYEGRGASDDAVPSRTGSSVPGRGTGPGDRPERRNEPMARGGGMM
jgi:hypothetical protein